MKPSLFGSLFALGTMLAVPARAVLLPDGTGVGIVDTKTVSSAVTSISSVVVSLELSAEVNGDLYVYLQHGSALSVLVNRPGTTAADSFGYFDSGLSIVLADAAPEGDLHVYQSSPAFSSGNPLTGTWQPDGRAVDPSLVTDTDARTAMLAVFNGLDASGTWTLYAEDASAGGKSVLVGWDLRIQGTTSTKVPDADPWRLTLPAAILGLLAWRRYTFAPEVRPARARNESGHRALRPFGPSASA